MKKIYITEFAAICNLGLNIEEIFKNAFCENNSHFTFDSAFIKDSRFPFGKIKSELPTIEDEDFNLECNRILLHILKSINIDRILNKYDKNKIGIVVATTNTGVEEYATTKNMKHLEFANPAEFLQKEIGVSGYYSTVSVACASGVKAFSLCKKLLDNEICDCVLVCGTDALSHLATHGFNSLELLSKNITNPFSKNRDGITLGEGGAIFVVEKEPIGNNPIEIAGIGETCDAYHYSTPEPSGEQAKIAIKNALLSAMISPEDIDYINLHGTGTNANDLMEANVISEIFADTTHCSSTKSLTGHILGAAGSVETALCCALLSNLNFDQKLYPHNFDGEYDDSLPKINLVEKGQKAKKLDTILSSSFGFGGANAVIILRRMKC